MRYFDTAYLGRLYLQDPGWEEVRGLAARSAICSSILGRAELVSTFHRKFREGAFNRSFLTLLLKQFEQDCEAGAYHWLPISERVVERLSEVYAGLPESITLRASDGLHLATAAEKGLNEIYSNDRRLLLAAPYFHLKGMDIL